MAWWGSYREKLKNVDNPADLKIARPWKYLYQDQRGAVRSENEKRPAGNWALMKHDACPEREPPRAVIERMNVASVKEKKNEADDFLIGL